MRYFYIIIFCIFSLQCFSQKYTVRKNKPAVSEEVLQQKDSVVLNSIYNAGVCLKKSATLQFSSIGCFTTAAILGAAGIINENKALYVSSAALVFGAIMCEVFSIQMKMDAGRELIISSNKIQFKF